MTCVDERGRGWKKEGKEREAEREAVIEAIQHWRHFDKLHTLPWLPVACVSSFFLHLPPPPTYWCLSGKGRTQKGVRGGDDDRREGYRFLCKEGGIEYRWMWRDKWDKYEVVTRQRQGLDVEGGVAAGEDYGWKVEVRRRGERPDLAGSRASGRGGGQDRMRTCTRVWGAGGGQRGVGGWAQENDLSVNPRQGPLLPQSDPGPPLAYQSAPRGLKSQTPPAHHHDSTTAIKEVDTQPGLLSCTTLSRWQGPVCVVQTNTVATLYGAESRHGKDYIYRLYISNENWIN